MFESLTCVYSPSSMALPTQTPTRLCSEDVFLSMGKSPSGQSRREPLTCENRSGDLPVSADGNTSGTTRRQRVKPKCSHVGTERRESWHLWSRGHWATAASRHASSGVMTVNGGGDVSCQLKALAVLTLLSLTVDDPSPGDAGQVPNDFVLTKGARSPPASLFAGQAADGRDRATRRADCPARAFSRRTEIRTPTHPRWWFRWARPSCDTTCHASRTCTPC